MYALMIEKSGVGIAANSAVVVSSLVVFIMDLIAVQVADMLGYT
jgi:phospholipid/cholesterol/gamma-HCH transport system permease protein